MDLREPKKKKRVRLQAQAPLPISTNENGEWRTYTAHLSASGTCIVDPLEIEAVYSMGFFGKGSLSRSFPSFGRRRFGVPPIIRNRQWIRRKQWLEELVDLNESSSHEDVEMGMGNGRDTDAPAGLVVENDCQEESERSTFQTIVEPEKTEEVETSENSTTGNKEEKFCTKETVEVDSQGQATLEKVTETKILGDSSVELAEDEKLPKFDSDAQEVQKAEKIDDPCPELRVKESEGSIPKTPEPAKTMVNKIEVNSSIEVIIEESCTVKRAKMDSTEKVDSENVKNTPAVICDEPMNVDEVVLDSTEDEEICEIVEKKLTNAPESHNDDVRVLNSEKLTKKSMDFPMNDDAEESFVDEEMDPYELLVLPDTDSDTESYLKNVKSRIEKDGFPVSESLHLTFEETFFLMYGLGCLQLVHYDGSMFSISNAWNHFQQQDKYFIQKYVVYHYFRSKGWVVKPGMKFGGDFLLYKQGPPFYHASYIVVIEVMDADTLIRDDIKSLRTITSKNLLGLERLSETIAKEILFAQILWPSSSVRNGTSMPVEALSDFTVREILWRRWNPKRKQDIASVDEEDSDSM